MADAKTDNGGEKDLAVLFPERIVPLGDQKVTVQELTFDQSLAFGVAIATVVDAMQAVAASRRLHDIEALRSVFAENRDHIIAMMAACTGLDEDWIRSRDATDGERLLVAWWGANADFFLMRVMVGLQLRRVRMLDAALDGPTSSPSSSTTDTTRSGSAATPAVS